MDGAICEFSEDEKMAYLRRAHEEGVTNIEMECTALGALCHKTGVKCAVVCVTLVDRLKGDQVGLGWERGGLYQCEWVKGEGNIRAVCHLQFITQVYLYSKAYYM